jgi:Mrp family chromosome partitioning ATPase
MYTHMLFHPIIVDADKHRELGSRFGVSGFPTIKYFPAGSTTPGIHQYNHNTIHPSSISILHFLPRNCDDDTMDTRTPMKTIGGCQFRNIM